MKNPVKFVACLLISLAVVLSCSSRTDQPTRNLIAHAYALAMTDSDAFQSFVRENPTLFASGGKWERAVTLLGKKLFNQGLQAIPSSTVETSVYNIAGSVGRPDLAPQVYDEITKTAADLMTMGKMLLTMPVIVQGLLNGDATAYQNSMFGLSASLLERSRALILPSDWVALKNISYQLNEWMMLQYAQHI